MKYPIRVIINSLLFSTMLIAVDEYKQPPITLEKTVLKEQLKQDIHNQHSIFELAQFYKNVMKYNKAIDLYKQSAIFEDEKGWYAEYMIGKCCSLNNDSKNALKYYNSAFQRRPWRAEPLYDMAHHYFLENNFSKVLSCATRGRKIPFPKAENLFIDPAIYHYKFTEQLTIASYHTNNTEKGLKYIDELLFDRKVPLSVKNNAFQNLLYYVENIKNVHYIPIQVNTPLLCEWSIERYKPYNPSIVKTETGYTLNCRSVNCVQWYPNYVVMDGTNLPKTKNIFVEYDKDLNKIFETQISEVPGLMKYETCIQGLEDLRIFHFKNEIYFVATTCQLHSQGIPKMCWGKFEKNDISNSISVNKITLLQGPLLERPEKNWLPLVKDGELLLIYSFGPYVIYKPNLKTGECEEFIKKDLDFDFSRFAGSAPPIPFDDGYLVIIHEGIWQDRKYYIHRFLYLDKNLAIKKISRPFTFKHKGIEMCCGMVLNHADDKLIMTIALEDREAYFALIDLPSIRSLLKDLRKE